MKFGFIHFIVLIGLGASASNITAQNVVIPDSIFKSRLIQFGHDTNMDGEISFEEALQVTELTLYPDYSYWDGITNIIHDLTGIEAFTNLEFIDITWNSISQVDFTSNVNLKTIVAGSLCRLKSMDVSNNSLLERLDLRYSKRLEIIDLRNCTNLKYLNISVTALPDVDLSGNIELRELYFKRAPMDTFDISFLKNLEVFDFAESKIKFLDVSQNKKLRRLTAHDMFLDSIIIDGNDSLEYVELAFNQLKVLDLSGAPNLEELNCNRGLINKLNVSGLEHLKHVQCYDNEIDTLDLRDLTSLEVLTVYRSEINEVFLKNNNALTYLNLSYNDLTEIDMDETPSLVWCGLGGNQFEELTFKGEDLKTIILIEMWDLKLLDISEVPNIEKLLINATHPALKVCVPFLPFPNEDIEVDLPNTRFELCTSRLGEIQTADFNIYPNPSSDEVSMEWGGAIINDANLIISELSGNIIRTQSFQQVNNLTVSVSNLSAGMYLMHFFSSDFNIVRRIVVE